MLRTCFLICVFFAWLPAAVHAQDGAGVPGWDVLPDSLFLIWHLDQDQITRLHVIDEDYDTERQQLAANIKLSDAERKDRLRASAGARLEEIKGVLGTEYFEDWQRRTHARTSGKGK